jgi:hypothetical protein
VQREYIYVVWDDDRIADVQVNRDVYFARTKYLPLLNYYADFQPPSPEVPGWYTHYYGSGTYISPILDSGAYSSTWYVVEWNALTFDGSYITLQTRVGRTVSEVLSCPWMPTVTLSGAFPFPDVAGQSVGAPVQGLDAPGRHILDRNGKPFPEARYIQYKVDFWQKKQTCGPPGKTAVYPFCTSPILADVTLHYNVTYAIYLPIVFKSYHP